MPNKSFISLPIHISIYIGLSIRYSGWNSTSVKISCETNFFLFSWKSELTKMDRLTIAQHLKIIKTYCKNGDGVWMPIFRSKFSSAMKHISHSVDMLINKIVVFGVLKIFKYLKRVHYIQKKSLFGALFGSQIMSTFKLYNKKEIS